MNIGSCLNTRILKIGRKDGQKRAVYMYGSAHYDFATPQQMRLFTTHRDEFMNQAVSGSFAKLLPQAIALAEKECLLARPDRYISTDIYIPMYDILV
jgi:hypothetical protein